jgi:hypothetical protein
MLEYLVWAWHWADPDGADLPWPDCRRFCLTRGEAASKRWAMLAFRSQLGSFRPDLPPVLPPPVLARFRRPYEVYVS